MSCLSLSHISECLHIIYPSEYNATNTAIRVSDCCVYIFYKTDTRRLQNYNGSLPIFHQPVTLLSVNRMPFMCVVLYVTTTYDTYKVWNQRA